jgi:hypothetical protein
MAIGVSMERKLTGFLTQKSYKIKPTVFPLPLIGLDGI